MLMGESVRSWLLLANRIQNTSRVPHLLPQNIRAPKYIRGVSPPHH